VSFTAVDASGWNTPRVQAYLVEHSHRPFDLERGPLFTAHLLTRSSSDHVLLICVHHICVDFWSLVVLTDELGRLYAADDPETEERQMPRPGAYAEFVRWQDDMLASAVGQAHEAYWSKQLAGTLPVLNLPADRPRPAVQTHRGASHSFQLSATSTRALRDLAGDQQVTLYVLLMAAFQSLLHRYTGDTDVVIGSPVAGRSLAGFAGVVGYFVNMVAVRGDLSGDPTFAEILARTRATVLGALAHQDFPFAMLVDRLEQQRDPSRSPVFQAAFVLERPHIREELAQFVLGESGARMLLGGLQVESLALEQRVAQFDLTLMMVEAGGALAASIQYNADLFDPSTIARLAQHYQTLVEGAAADPNRRLSELPLLSREEHRQLLEWKGAVADASPTLTLQGLFEEQVEQSPDAVAVASDDEQLTYRELNHRANQLARTLRKHGVGPEILVGVCMDRSPEMIAAMLGILKAGGAYFPLDPDYPQERLSFMLRDGQIPLVLAKRRFVENLPPSMAQVVTLDATWAQASDESGANPVSPSTAQNLAYVMYTSGSTGTPNGVAVCQQSIVRLVHDPNYAELKATDVVLQLAPPTFDAATFEVWASLLHGGRLVLAPYEKPSLEQVGETLARHRVSTLWLTSGLFHQLVDHDVDVFGSVRQLLAGGDVLSVSHVRKVLARFPSCRLINGYGPTENTTFTCCHSMQGEESASSQTVPIGRPITGTEVFVVDRSQRAVPVGVAGELVTGGTGLARGYLNRPALTAERFVPSTPSESAGARLYKTGDLVRYLESGTIEFLGRLDHQLKIRGFRVELGEIETALTSHPMVRACVVVAQSGSTAKRLIAYLVAGSGGTPSTTQLREYLGQRLPDYMVPSVFITLDEFPLTVNGKVDRRALPSPDHSRPELDNRFEAPQPGTEARLAEIWSQLLGVNRVGRHDNFFELGGHSLIGTQVVSRVRQTTGVDVSLRCLFERPTVAALAEWLDTITQQDPHDLMLVPVADDEPQVVSFTQERMWLLEQLISGTPVYNIPAVIRLEGELNASALEQAFNEIRRRHEALRTNFPAVDGQPVPSVSAADACTAPIVDIGGLTRDVQVAALRALTRAEALRPFDLVSDPLLRISLARLGPSEHVLFVTLHHIVSDGWSIGIVMRELAAIYESFASGRSSRLAEPAIQYRTYAHWQRRWLQGGALDEQLAYWKSAMSGARPSIDVPTDRARTSPPSYRGATEVCVLRPDLVKAIGTFGKERGVSPFMVMLTALNVLLFRMTQQADLVVGTVTSGRTRAEVEPLIGCFINFLPLRTKLFGDESAKALLQQVRTTVLEAHAHQECPFQHIVEAVRPDRGNTQNPLFNVAFQFDNYPQTDAFTHTLTASFETPHRQISQLDLRFIASETRDGTALSCEYSTDLFDASTIQRMLQHVCVLLEGIVENPEQRISDLTLLTEDEGQQLLTDWNRTSAAYPENRCLHELFEVRVAEQPDAIALAFEDERWSYGEVDARANQVARYLRDRGAGLETRVGICVSRSPDLVVGLLGILKSGAAFVPIDPTYPPERLAVIVQNAGIDLALTQDDLRAVLEDRVASVVSLDGDQSQIARESPNALCLESTPDQLAYTIYTSGSTGTPKGVLIPHRGVLNNIWDLNTSFDVGPDDRLMLLSSLSFDMSVYEVFGTLAAGGCLVIPGAADARDPVRWTRLMVRHFVTVWNSAPALLGMLVEYLETEGRGAPPALRLAILGGDWIPVTLPDRLRALVDGLQFISLGGATEASIHSTIYPVGPVDPGWKSIPYGRPMVNQRCYVLDENLQPLPVGVPGELHLFEPAGSRLYKTGDQVIHTAEGYLRLLGRLDFQVKIRGLRIELGDIESALRRHEAVTEAVVVARNDERGDKCLVAYVVAPGADDLLIADLRRFLGAQLPGYMVPAAFVALDALPISPNGKVDRKALPAFTTLTMEPEDVYVAPRTPVEKLVAHVWGEVLKIDSVSRAANFFDLGGHSLLATRVMVRLHDALPFELPLRVLFQSPTVEGLAESIRQYGQTEGIDPASLEDIVAEVDSLSDEEVQQMLDGNPIEVGDIRGSHQ
jgi:amino acid adenylation domain-containing protein